MILDFLPKVKLNLLVGMNLSCCVLNPSLFGQVNDVEWFFIISWSHNSDFDKLDSIVLLFQIYIRYACYKIVILYCKLYLLYWIYVLIINAWKKINLYMKKLIDSQIDPLIK